LSHVACVLYRIHLNHTSPSLPNSYLFFFNDPATTEIYTLSLHDALPIYRRRLKANQTGKKFRVGIKSNISTNRNNLNFLPVWFEIGRAVQQECRDRSRMPSSA